MKKNNFIDFIFINIIYFTYLFISSFNKNFTLVKINISKFISAEKQFLDKILYSKFYLLLILPLVFNLYLIISLPITYDDLDI